ncbi:energy-coupling factor transporter ATPase [Bifidobacterium magnum]|uniref:ABC transporter, ATP-binding protein n=1 Tax=Bifidobacterium magnum TaxID=1692 RepID=A0A087BCV0_9BIFI|nr:energy-coupling factor transporter ATPase [Bifidobacterium magnum]KFI68850.1 ABC transporter, ATP-binding protein [Bifidobacterium magnum]
MGGTNESRAVLADLHDVGFRYGDAAWVFRNISLRIHAGERICLTGGNGSGKSTLGRVIAGLVAPDEGDVTLMGQHVFNSSRGADPAAYRAARRSLGAVFQNPADQMVTTRVEDDVAFGPENLNVSREHIGERVTHALQQVRLLDQRQADPMRMSGGQQQRVAIAGMLAMHSRLLVLDEPTAMLDERSRAEVMDTLRHIQRRGTAVVLITHHEDELAGADHVWRLENGALHEVETAHETQTQPIPPHPGQSAQDGTRIAVPVPSSRSTPAAIELRNVSFRYPDAPDDVLRDFSLTVRNGECVALMGPNGSGKTTCARLICALQQPTSGRVEVAGIPVATPHGRHVKEASGAQLDRLHRTLGFVMQHAERQLFAPTVREDIAYGPHAQGRDTQETDRLVLHAAEQLHIEHLLDRNPMELSMGQQRLVAIAGVLACEPRILVMDEPTAGLDEAARERLLRIVRALREQGMTIVMVTHERHEAEIVADRIVEFAPRPQHERAQAPLDSWIGRLDPRCKMLGFLVLMFSAFALRSLAQLAASLVVVGAIIALSRVPLRHILRQMRGFLVLFAIIGALNIFVVHTGSTLVQWGAFIVTTGGVGTAVLYAVRFSLVMVLAAILLATTTPTAMTDAFGAILKPLRVFGVHTQDIALVFSLALRFLPTLTQEAHDILEAQICRGASFAHGSPFKRVRALCAIMIPVFTASLRHADTLSLALDARCYEDGIPRTQWRALRMRGRDWMFLAIVCIQIVVAMGVPSAVFGWGGA